MLHNYLKIALRNLAKHKANTAINIAGLAIGMACCLLIVLYVADELSYDQHWSNGERVYRMALERRYPGRSTKYAVIPPSYAQSVKKEIPEIEQTTRVFSFGNNNDPVLFKIDGRTVEERGVQGVDSTFFQVFQVPFLRGQAERALTRPNTVVLTQSTAARLFGSANPVGKVLEIVQGPKLEVTGICADPVHNTHFTFNFLVSARGPEPEQPNHIGFSAYTYLLLKPNTSPETVEAKLPAVVEKYAAGEVERTFGVSYRDYIKAGNGYFYFLQPLRSIHLDSHLEVEQQANGSRSLVSIFSIIAAFVLLIACINFMNLSTARSSERAREVGIRKSLGSTTNQLAAQFLTESVLLSLFSLIVALVLVVTLLAPFNTLAGKALTLLSLVRWQTLPLLFGGAIAVGLLAGSYPAGVLSAFEPIKVLKGKFSSTRQGHLLRNGLVVFQFAISVLLIVSTIVVFSQLAFIQQKELGFTKESVLKLKGAGFLDKNTEAFKQEITKLAGVASVGGTSSAPGEEGFFGITFRKNGENETITGKGCVVDEQYLQTLRMSMLAGRPFTRQFDDSLSVILNEEAARQIGLTDPVGKQITSPDNFSTRGGPPVTYTIVGVVQNFHFGSLHERISPLFILNDRLFRRVDNELAVRIQADAPASVVSQIERVWKQYLPDQPFHYSYLDADWSALYKSEQVAQRIFGVFALLAIFIACMGLLGLAMYVIRLRTKEIGIRKTLGASIPGLVALLSKDFLKLVLMAIIIASPVAWYAMDRWLQDFAYRIDIEWWVFVVAGFLAIGIAVLTVSFQSIKAALMNPIKSLRSE
ncbi:ABC transporter permease [Spirosoma radiotolerans]|uniref:ABC transporter permease n=1 Tax=Spirosoma radiotolerans TaxID=1379870 RepID=A0A0E3V9F3_9BACT|nr:ABC transporter permease [Spirosoma radiotolerans]AKD57617.1 ABC transporter permease [Spirosoma radiotolerans]